MPALVLHVRIAPEQHAALVAEAIAEGVSVSTLCARALRAYLAARGLEVGEDAAHRRPSGRPPSAGSSPSASIHLPASWLAAIDACIQGEVASRAGVVREALRAARGRIE